MAAGGKAVDLNRKILRPQHVGALFAAVKRYKVTELNLANNQLGADGGALVVAALKTNTTLTFLRCALLGRRSRTRAARGAFLARRQDGGRTEAERNPSFPACVSRMSPAPHAHRPHTACTCTEHIACLPPRQPPRRCRTHARTPRGPRPRPPLPTGGWRARVHPSACTCPSQAARQQLRRRRQASPQSGCRQRPRDVSLAQACMGSPIDR